MDVLHDACSGLSNDDDCSRRWTRLAIPYPACDDLDVESKRPFVYGIEHLAMSPGTILQLDAYFGRLPRLEDSKIYQRHRPLLRVTSADPLTRLSPEILSMIMAEMRVATLLKWQEASTKLANFPLSNRFWEKAVFRDMPWLNDVVSYDAQDAFHVDWEAVYKDLHVASKVASFGEMHGLCNRRRIWQDQCPTIAKQYAFTLANKNVGLRALMPQLDQVTVTSYRRLVEPAPVKTSIYTPTLLNAVAELETMEPELVVFWTSIGTLAAMDTLKHGSMESDYHGYWEDCHTAEARGYSETVQIPKDDWVTGFSFFIRETRFKSQEPVEETVEEQEDWDMETDREQYSDEEASPSPMSDDEEDAMLMGDYVDPELQQDEYGDEDDGDEDMDGHTESEYSFDEEDDSDDEIVGRQGSRSYQTSWLDIDRRVVGVEIHLAKGDRIPLGRETSESRMIHVDHDKFVVGLSTVRRTVRGIVTQANLIQAPISMTNCAGLARVEDTRWARHGIDPCLFTWRPQPPPADMCLSGSVDGVGGARDARYAEVLVLGDTDEEMADIIAIHATLSPMSLRIDYGNRHSRRIGHSLSDDAPRLDIDGRGGERIAAIFITTPGIRGWRIRILTNRNRQLCLGVPCQFSQEVRFPPLGQPGDLSPALCGVYWLWRAGINSYVDVSVSGIGCMTWNNHFIDASGLDEADASLDPNLRSQ